MGQSFSLGLRKKFWRGEKKSKEKVTEIDGSDGPNSINELNAKEMYMLK